MAFTFYMTERGKSIPYNQKEFAEECIIKIATTTGDFGFYCKTDEERIRELHRAGFRYIDLNMYNFTPESPYK